MSLAISVAINTYNREREIAETLDAVLSQSAQPAEVVVVDDGSTDDTQAVVSRYSKYVRYCRISNVGPGQSRHHAVTNCRSKWIATCDSDDLWTSQHLAGLTDTIGAYPDAVLVFSNTTRFGPEQDGNYDHFASIPNSWWNAAITNRTRSHWLLGENSYRQLLTTNPVYPSCQAFNAEMYAAIGGAHPSLSRITSEDSDLTRRFSLAGPLACNSEITVRMRKHDGNFSESIWTNLFGKYQILDRHVIELELDHLDKAAAADERDRSLLRAFRHAYWERNRDRAELCASLMKGNGLTLKDRLRLLHLKITPTRSS